MKKIRQRCFATATLLVISLICLLFAAIQWMENHEEMLAFFVLPGLILVSIVAFILLIYALKRQSAAKLIWDNQIINIPVARLDDGSHADLNMTVSGFGILLDSKIIKFNQGGIKLTDVTIGADCMRIQYEKGDEMHEVNLLHQIPEPEELQEIIEKFCFETGVIPKVG